MTDQGQVTIVRVGVALLQFVDSEHDVENAAVVLHPAADKFLAHLRHHRIVGFEIVLDADDHIAAGSKDVGEKRVFGVLDGVAVAEDRDRQIDHLGDRFHFAVAAHGKVDGNGAVAAQGIHECQRLVMDRPFARGEIGKADHGANRKNDNSALHVRLGN